LNDLAVKGITLKEVGEDLSKTLDYSKAEEIELMNRHITRAR
jgi:hypothetical protein